MTTPLLTPPALATARALRDLTDPAGGPHAMQLLLTTIEGVLARTWGIPLRQHRADPVVPITQNYDRLGYAPDVVTRDARYTRYVDPRHVLRTQTSALIPPLLDRLAAAPPADTVLSCPGLVYRRDVIDRLHVGEPHQVDLWRVRAGPPPLAVADLQEMIGLVVGSALPGHDWRAVPAQHPYTTNGLQIDVQDRDRWVEVGECGLAHHDVLTRSGMPAAVSGLAMGLGLDRLLMLRKGIDDIRLLRSPDPRVARQLLDLEPYRPVSSRPPIRRDLSLALSGDPAPEVLGDRVRSALGEDATAVESVEVLGATLCETLPEGARTRLGCTPDQVNVLLRVVLRHPDRTLTSGEANALRDRVYSALHQGHVWAWATLSGTDATAGAADA